MSIQSAERNNSATEQPSPLIGHWPNKSGFPIQLQSMLTLDNCNPVFSIWSHQISWKITNQIVPLIVIYNPTSTWNNSEFSWACPSPICMAVTNMLHAFTMYSCSLLCYCFLRCTNLSLWIIKYMRTQAWMKFNKTMSRLFTSWYQWIEQVFLPQHCFSVLLSLSFHFSQYNTIN